MLSSGVCVDKSYKPCTDSCLSVSSQNPYAKRMPVSPEYITVTDVSIENSTADPYIPVSVSFLI